MLGAQRIAYRKRPVQDNITSQVITSVGEIGEPSFTGNVDWYSHYGNRPVVPQKIKNRVVISLSWYLPKRLENIY